RPGPPPDLQGGARRLAALRAMAGAAQIGARPPARRLCGRAQSGAMTQAGPDALPPEPALREAALALGQGRLEAAEGALRQFLQASPRNPNALRMLAEVAIRTNCFADAEGLL